LCAISLGAAEWGWRNAPAANFYLIVTRAWELGAGAICALVLHGRVLRPDTRLASLGLGMILFSVFAYDANTPFPSLYALVPVIGTALVILFAGPETPVGRLLSLRGMVGIGLISYSAYLWHQPLFAFARIRSLGHVEDALMLILAATSLGLGWLSWRYVERPFRHGGGALLRQTGVFVASAAGLAAFIGFGLYGHLSEGRKSIWLAANPEKAQMYDLWNASRAAMRVSETDNACRFRTGVLDEDVVARLNKCHSLHGSGLMVVGDSHAIDLHRGYFQVWDGPFLFGFVGGGCRPHEERPPCDLDGLVAQLEAHPHLFSEVHYTQAGFHLLEASWGERGRNMFARSGITQPLDPEDYSTIPDRIEDIVNYLLRLNKHVPVTFVGPRIEPHIPWQAMIRLGCRYNYALRSGQADVFRNMDRTLSKVVEKNGLGYVSQVDGMSLDLGEDFMTCDTLYWADGDHWTSAGAARFVRRMVQEQTLELP